MVYHSTILGNPRWLHNPLATYCLRDQSPCPIICSFNFFQAKLGDILYRIIEGILHSLPHFAPPCPMICSPCLKLCSSCPMFCSPLPNILLILAGMVWTRHKSSLAQVYQFRDLVTDRRLSVVSTSEPGDKACHFYFCIFLTVLCNSLELLHSTVS